ncbi:MerR family transcriptional regulator [Streptococcus sp. S784/96/1]|uniref:MerR family transcriptional regulator n=1 Tax=Streptococcus sp. S784/96/1 TaxID=2653499 RepID=UPI00138A1BEC|nr:MerR family transcriptional regulator [Streptococcus sp. S784/96/1]
MNLLSREAETELVTGTLERVDRYLEAKEQLKPRVLGLITASELQDELGIKYKTIRRWEQEGGLRRYQPPLEDTRKVFYRVSDILVFLGVENGKI